MVGGNQTEPTPGIERLAVRIQKRLGRGNALGGQRHYDQYFPNKAAIIYTLGDRYVSSFRDAISASLERTPRTRAAFGALMVRLLEDYYRLYLDDPVVRDIWMGVSVDKSMRDLDREDTERLLAILHDAAAPLFPGTDPEVLRTDLRLLLEFAAAATRTAVDKPLDEGRMLMDRAKLMLRAIWKELA